MPKINIREQEAISFASFDATENNVLVPMVYIRSHKEQLPSPTLFSNATDFKNLYRSKCSYLELDDEGHGTILDRTYFMVYELLLQGIGVIVAPIDGGEHDEDKDVLVDEDAQKSYLGDFNYNGFIDRNLYNIKFITSGAYSNIDTGVYDKMVTLAMNRGDAVALLELPTSLIDDTGKEIEIKTAEDIVNAVHNISGLNYKYAAITFPWCTFTTTALNRVKNITMPASFAYLMAYANSVKVNSNWFAAAGTIRGVIPNLVAPKVNVGEALMHFLQNDGEYTGSDQQLTVNINPVYNAGAYGYRIWGNKVAWKRSSAEESQYLEFLNVRILMCDIKKQIFHAAMRVTFEPNDDIVWYNFKSLASTLLDKMKSGRGIKWYKWFKEETKEKALIKATVTIQPIEAVESFDINIVLTDQDADVYEGEE